MIINGSEMQISSCRVIEILEKLNLDSKKVVVEINMDIIPVEEFSERIIQTDDKIEIISFVGGG
ncbi:sulfur carrier protein ThiS [uncultured Clostridium sp.]|jgi:sulfur carrier protein|uniref:sulfur carrier protein ThiS n=1 Tax=uncultured Clostridium sp. TaxID=59620 RepID=UPI00260C261C|nr:sulfur carrier protein ThiS [uncultured Clostridium sp.]